MRFVKVLNQDWYSLCDAAAVVMVWYILYSLGSYFQISNSDSGGQPIGWKETKGKCVLFSATTHQGLMWTLPKKMAVSIPSLKHVFGYGTAESRGIAGELPPTCYNRLWAEPLKHSHQAARAHVRREAEGAGVWLDLAHLSYLTVDNPWCSCGVRLSMARKFLMST